MNTGGGMVSVVRNEKGKCKTPGKCDHTRSTIMYLGEVGKAGNTKESGSTS